MKIKLFGKEIFFSAIIICIFSAIPIRTFLRIWKNTLGTWFWIISFKSHNGGQGLVFFQFLHFWWYEPSILDNKCLKGSSYEENVKKYETLDTILEGSWHILSHVDTVEKMVLTDRRFDVLMRRDWTSFGFWIALE